MIKNVTFSDIARNIQKINRLSWLVKVCVVVTTRHIICIDTDGEVEFFRYPVNNTKAFQQKLFILYSAMLNADYSDCGKLRVKLNKKYSQKMLDLWQVANQKKLLKLL